MARNFGGLTLHGYSDETELGYQGLMKVFLAYTALEKLGKVLVEPVNRKAIGPHVLRDRCVNYDQTTITDCWKTNDPTGEFVKYVAKHCEHPNLKVKVSGLLEAERPNLAILSHGIRNLFAHGHLTPSANSCCPKRIAKICDGVSEFVINVLDEEFYKVIHAYCDQSGIDYETLATSRKRRS